MVSISIISEPLMPDNGVLLTALVVTMLYVVLLLLVLWR